MRFVTAFLALISLLCANADEIQDYQDIWSLQEKPGICTIHMTQVVGEKGEGNIMHSSFTLIADIDKAAKEHSSPDTRILVKSFGLGRGELAFAVDFTTSAWTVAVGGAHATRFHRPLLHADGRWPRFVFSSRDSIEIMTSIAAGENVEFAIIKPNKETVKFRYQDPAPKDFKKRFESLLKCFEEMSPNNALH